MATAVLRSHDCLKNPHHLSIDSRPPPLHHKKPLRSPPLKKPRTRSKPTPSCPKPLIAGHVTILKRGEDLKSISVIRFKTEETSADSDLPSSPVKIESDRSDTSDTDLCSTARLGPDPKDLKFVYAGPAFVASPAPNVLPFPAFLMKNKVATQELRCMLRLD